jgi:cytoskeletal protein CcmA (bactofilin family)
VHKAILHSATDDPLVLFSEDLPGLWRATKILVRRSTHFQKGEVFDEDGSIEGEVEGNTSTWRGVLVQGNSKQES